MRRTTTSSSAPARRAASSPTGCRPIRGTRVLLLEAGGSDRNFWIRLPVGYFRTIYDPRFSRLFDTEPAEGTAGRNIVWPRGRVLGGSSSINGLIFIRGQHEDFDGWERAGAAGWGYRVAAAALQALRALRRRRERVPRRERRVRRLGSAEPQFLLRGLGGSRRAARPAAQSGLQRAPAPTAWAPTSSASATAGARAPRSRSCGRRCRRRTSP